MAMNYKEISGNIFDKLPQFKTGAQIMADMADSLERQGMLPPKLPQLDKNQVETSSEFISPSDTFQGKLRDYRKRLGMSQKRLASHIGLTPTHFNRVEKGTRRIPEVDKVVKMITSLYLSRNQAEDLIRSAELSTEVLDLTNEQLFK